MLAILIIFMGSGVYASSMAAWATRFGTSLFVHNSSTGIISASMCNSSTLVFPVDPPNVLEIGIILSNRTGITAMGHYDGVTSWASLFYLGEDLNIVNNVYSCINSTGQYHRESTFILQMEHPTEDTAMAVVLLDGEDPEYKLSYSGLHNHIYQATGDSQGWTFDGPISQDSNLTGHILGAAGAVSEHGGSFSIVASPRDHNIEVMVSDTGDDWHITTYPQSLGHHSQNDPPQDFVYSHVTPSWTLPGWTGEPGALGVALDSDYHYHLFYIGSDHRLHHTMTGPPDTWFLMEDQDSKFWPLADEPNADLAVVGRIEKASISVYYTSGDALIEARYEAGAWQLATAVHNSTFDDDSKDSPASGPMFGLAFGLAFGSLILIAMTIGTFYLIQRRRKAKKQGLDASYRLSGCNKYHSRPSTAGQQPLPAEPESKSDADPVSPLDFTSHPNIDTTGRGAAQPRSRVGMIYDSDSDDGRTVLSERWNKKPGGPGFEHVKPYDEASSVPWRRGSRKERALSTPYPGSPSRSLSSLPPKSKTTGQLPESMSTNDLPDPFSDDTFSLPIQSPTP